MTPPAGPKSLFVLNIHADYQCGHEGACCTAGWHIPVDAGLLRHLRAALAEGALVAPVRPHPGAALDSGAACFSEEALPEGAAAIIANDEAGRCVFFDRRAGHLCAIQRACGHENLPAACRLFPRVVLDDARGVHLTLSHFCPTAARMLFRDDVDELSIVVDPPGPIRRESYEGFDATATIPPLVRPGLVANLEAASTWDAFVVRSFGRRNVMPESTLDRLVRAAEQIRAWKPEAGSLADAVRGVCEGSDSASDITTPGMMPAADAARLFESAVETVPPGLPRPELPADFEDAYTRLVVPAWPGLSRPIRRYLAAKAFASWTAYIGEGLRAQIATIAVALGVLLVESARQAASAGRPLDSEMLVQSFRQADWLLVHLASADGLTRNVGQVEKMAFAAYLAEIGLHHV